MTSGTQESERIEGQPGASLAEYPGKDPKTGYFLPGHQIPRIAAERRAREHEEMFGCPAALERRGLAGLWDLQVQAAKKGNASALSKLWDLINKYGKEPERADADSKFGERYVGLPDEVAEVLRELDVGIAEVVHRGTLGLPMSDVEQLIFETAQAIRDGGPKCAAVTRWRGVLIREIQKLRDEQKGTNDVKEQGTREAAGTGTASIGGSDAGDPAGGGGRGSAGPATRSSATSAHNDDAAGDHDDTLEPAASGQAEANDRRAGRQPVGAG